MPLSGSRSTAPAPRPPFHARAPPEWPLVSPSPADLQAHSARPSVVASMTTLVGPTVRLMRCWRASPARGWISATREGLHPECTPTAQPVKPSTPAGAVAVPDIFHRQGGAPASGPALGRWIIGGSLQISVAVAVDVSCRGKEGVCSPTARGLRALHAAARWLRHAPSAPCHFGAMCPV
jgi:hypothetical protein